MFQSHGKKDSTINLMLVKLGLAKALEKKRKITQQLKQ